MRKNIAVFGAGKAGQRAGKVLSKSYDISYYVDNKSTKKVLGKYPCYAPSRLISHPVDFIFVCSMYSDQIRIQLIEMGLKNFQVYKSDGFKNDFIRPRKIIKKIKSEEESLFLIYQVGKVGSNTIANGLSGLGHKNISFHTFRSSDVYAQWNLKPKGRYNISQKLSFFNLWMARRAIEFRKETNKETVFITGVREPISRAISVLMQSMHILLPQHLNRAHTVEQDMTSLFEEMFYRWIDFDYFFNWFESEFAYVTGFRRLMEQPFDKENGMTNIQLNDLKLIVYRQDKLGELLNNSFYGSIPGLSNSKGHGNRSEKKWYSSLSKEVKDNFSVNEDFANKIYSSKYCKSFFTSRERDELIAKWTSNGK